MPDKLTQRLILLPVKVAATDDAPAEYDTLGVKNIEIMRETVNYRDVAKVVVRGTDEAVATLQARSREHFATLWPAPMRADDLAE